MPSEMVERVARVLHAANRTPSPDDWYPEDSFSRSWEGLTEANRAEYLKIATEAIQAVHDYLFWMAEGCSNIGKPYTDNSYGTAAQQVMRSIDPQKITDILSKPPYLPQPVEVLTELPERLKRAYKFYRENYKVDDR